MENKIKICFAFDPTEAWNNLFFREFIQAFVRDVENYEVFLVTTNQDTDYINDVVAELGMDVSNVTQVTNDSAVVARLNTLKCLIYLAEDNVLVNLVNNTLPIQLSLSNVTGCQALVLNNIVDSYKVQQKFITYFHFWIDQINKQY